MRVVQVVLSSTGGIGLHAADLAGRLADLGHDVRVLGDAPTLDLLGPLGPLGPLGLHGPVVVDTRRPGSLRRARRLLAGADVVHAHGFRAGLLAAALTTAVRGPSLVVSLHNEIRGPRGWRRRLGTATARLVARRADLVTGASSDLVDLARRLGARWAEPADVPSPRVAGLLALEPLDPQQRTRAATDLLAASGVPADGPLVLLVARIAPQKALHVAVDAAAAGPRPATWAVVGGGDPDLAARLTARATRTGVPLHLLGRQDEDAVGRWLRAASVLVVTSEWEARALVVQEAMAAGTPVVATDVGGLPDLVAGTGAVVPAGDAQAVAEAVAAVLADPAEASRQGRAGRERAAGWDSPERSAGRWVERYRRLTRT